MTGDKNIELDDLYQDIVLDHYKRPRNHELLEESDLKAKGFNPFCGDEVQLTLGLNDAGCVEQVGMIGQGCAISQASGSMLGETIKGLTVDEAKALVAQFKSIMQGREPSEEEEEELGQLVALLGVRKFPIRIKCALLSWATLQDAIEEYRKP